MVKRLEDALGKVLMVDRLASLIDPGAWKPAIPSRPYHSEVLRNRQRLARKKAQKMLAFIREPTERMLATVIGEPSHLYGTGGRDAAYEENMKAAVQTERAVLAQRWREMIDAALIEAEESAA